MAWPTSPNVEDYGLGQLAGFKPKFKQEAVRQVLDRGYSVAEILARLGVSALVFING